MQFSLLSRYMRMCPKWNSLSGTNQLKTCPDRLSFSFEPDLNNFYRLIEKDFHVAVLPDGAAIQLVVEVSILLESDIISSRQCTDCAVKNKVCTWAYHIVN